jgi:outer membrane receptor for ferrienterochelin and colicin
MNTFLFLIASIVIFSTSLGIAQENDAHPVWEEDTELQNELRFLRLEGFLDLELNIASTKAETSLQSPSTVTVIDRKMLEEHNFASIAAAVQTLAGIQVYRTAFKQQLATVRGVLQDHYANKVLVMINNVPSWHAVTGEGNLDRVSIHDVERIEVLRGPASVIYGSQAYVGAINIVLRQTAPNSNTAEIHTGIGNQGAHSIGAHYRFHSDTGLSVFTAVNQDRDKRYHTGYTDEEGVNGTLDDYHDRTNASVSLEYKAHSLLLNAFQNDEGNFEGSTQKFSAGAGNNHDVDGILLGYTYSHHWNENFYSKLQLFYDWNERNFSRSANDDIRANVLGQRLGGNIRNIYSISDDLAIEVGGDYDLRKSQEYKNLQRSTHTILAENNLSKRSVSEYSGYAQVDWKPLPAWRILIGSRLTHSETFGQNISSRGTIVYSIDAKNTLKLIAGQSFRTPSLFELYFMTPSNTVFGSETLNPETADTFELGYQHTHGPFYLQTLAYYSIYKDKIHRIKGDVVLDDSAIAHNVNVYTNGGDFTAQGLEVELKYLNPQWANIFLNFDYVQGNKGDNLPGTDHYNFKYIPKFTASAGVYKNIQGIDFSLLGNYLSSSQGSQANVSDSLSLDFNLAYQHPYQSLRLKHVMSIQNLTNTPINFPEYVRRKSLNEIPLAGSERGIFYTLIVNF